MGKKKETKSANDLVSAKEATMTSLQIAEVTGKQHSHVMEAIRAMEPAWEEVCGSKFRLTSYIDRQGKERPMYSLTKTECLYISTKFNDEARARLVLRWEKLDRMDKEEREEVGEVLWGGSAVHGSHCGLVYASSYHAWSFSSADLRLSPCLQVGGTCKLCG